MNWLKKLIYVDFPMLVPFLFAISWPFVFYGPVMINFIALFMTITCIGLTIPLIINKAKRDHEKNNRL